MKKITAYLALFVASTMFILISCQKYEDLSPIPEWETGVHGYAKFASGSPQDFVFTQDEAPTINFQWVSIDSKNTVTKIQFFVLFNDSYTHPDGTRRTARIGGTSGRLLKTIEGSDVPANRTNLSLAITQADLYEVYNDAMFDYGTGTAVKVFESDADNNALRSPAGWFIPGDAFSLRWELTTADGRVFKQWSNGICSEYETYHGAQLNDGGFNCSVDFAIKCESDIAGTFDYVTTDMTKGPSGAPFPGTTSGTVTWEQKLDGDGNPIPGAYTSSDATFGQFEFAWADTPAVGITVVDACNAISTTGSDQYGDSYTYKVLSISGPVMVIQWNNTYSDGGTTTLTRQDGNDWPPLFSN